MQNRIHLLTRCSLYAILSLNDRQHAQDIAAHYHTNMRGLRLMSDKKRADLRTQRTQSWLHSPLRELMDEKAYE